MSSNFSGFFETAADIVGQRNPQLLREWQGRLRLTNLLFTGVISVVLQVALLGQRLAQVPLNKYGNTRYCITQNDYECWLNANNQTVVHWSFIWADVFRDFSFAMVYGLVVCGLYLLVADITKESQKGTLNFLRMSPLPAGQVLLGKLLGVPVLLYLCFGLMLPIHFSAGILGSYPITTILSFYGLLVAVTGCFYLAALWGSLLIQKLYALQAWLIAFFGIVLLFLGQPHLLLYPSAVDWFRLFNPLCLLVKWEVASWKGLTLYPFGAESSLAMDDMGWFFLPIGQHDTWYVTFALANAIFWGLWFWSLLKRKFQTPAKTPLGKRQSYGLTLCVSLMVAGFNMQHITVDSKFQPPLLTFFESYLWMMTAWAVLLMFVLMPTKQALLDWARYSHQQSRTSRRLHGDKHSVESWLYQEGSPPTVAFAFNLAIIAFVLLWSLILHVLLMSSEGLMSTLSSWVFTSFVLMTCSLLLQRIVLSNVLHWRWLAFGIVVAITLGWPTVLSIGNISFYGSIDTLWLTTLFSSARINLVGAGEIIFMTVFHCALILGLNAFLNFRLRRLGQSEWKAIVAKST